MLLDARDMDYTALNTMLRQAGDCRIINCLGHRFLGAGMSDKRITISGIPGNALGAYLDGAEIEVYGNAQDAVGDTMNAGRIVIHGNVGDAAGYAMRGGKIFVRGDAGYRTGIHMKAYREKNPVLVIGGRAGSFLGEYQAGGAGMHGGKMYIRSDCAGIRFPVQVQCHPAEEEDLARLRPILEEYCACFGLDPKPLLDSPFTVVAPDSANPYKQMYVAN